MKQIDSVKIKSNITKPAKSTPFPLLGLCAYATLAQHQPTTKPRLLVALCKKMKFALVFFLIINLSGCILPYPHYNWKTPVYTGVVTNSDGDPLEKVEIYLEKYPDHRATSNENGEFILPPVKDFRLVTLICPGPCDAMSEVLILKASTRLGKEGSVEVHTCIGHPDSQCNGRTKNVYITIE